MTDSGSSESRKLRIAYIGTAPQGARTGVAGAAWLVVINLAELGHQVDCYVVREPSDSKNRQLEPAQDQVPGLHFVRRDSGWRWGRWYNRLNVLRMITSQLAEGTARHRLTRALIRNHRQRPYDVLYQYSAIESFGLNARALSKAPPLVIHPSVHTAGELRWLRKERHLNDPSQGKLRLALTRSWLAIRSAKQRRSIAKATKVLATSKRFGELMEQDYGLNHNRVAVVPYAIDIKKFYPRGPLPSDPIGPSRVAFIGRIVVRKGVEQVVELSHRLSDLSGKVMIEIVGNQAQWSDYRALLDNLHPKTARYNGKMGRDELADWLPTCDLLIQPAKYEPFGLTVAEALASGVPVVTTTEVGASEEVDPGCAVRVPPSDPVALERAVRGMLERMRSPEAPTIRALARAEAERLWAPDRIAQETAAALASVIDD